ncbi:hypothetical protein E2C01_052533 [Portunus trituberculatus]|uniref:Uncharacterized protein n=1 Tax=Portunus trituberculatus TaxID=210409 RepID=A0A5B7GNA3_PORTR|nr:hypothetical protein [Portunus trituberculatus]
MRNVGSVSRPLPARGVRQGRHVLGQTRHDSRAGGRGGWEGVSGALRVAEGELRARHQERPIVHLYVTDRRSGRE